MSNTISRDLALKAFGVSNTSGVSIHIYGGLMFVDQVSAGGRKKSAVFLSDDGYQSVQQTDFSSMPRERLRVAVEHMARMLRLSPQQIAHITKIPEGEVQAMVNNDQPMVPALH